MDNKKDNSYYVNKILTEINFLVEHTKDISRENFSSNELLIDSIMFRFIQISEHIKKLTKSFKDKHNEIPWRDIVGLRNRIVHEYGNVDLDIIYNAVKQDIFTIKKLFESIE